MATLPLCLKPNLPDRDIDLHSTPTLKDVAEAAGVATTTVARVINDKGYVAEDTRERVMKAVEATGYRVNSLARTLKSNRSNVIGHLLRSTDPNPFFVKVARGVEEYARGRSYTTLTYNMQGAAEAERRGIDTFLNWRVDALVFSTPVSEDNVAYAVKSGVPVVQVERPRSEAGHRITVKNYQGASRAMRHLLDLGHRSIAYIGEEPGSQGNAFADYVEEERFGAYRDAKKNHGAFDEALVRFTRPQSAEHIPGAGYGARAMSSILDAGTKVTAVLASSDMIAAGVLQAVHASGLRSPEDVSVIGFDDTLSPYLSPLLTTVRLPAQKLGETAAKLLIDQLEKPGSKANKLIELDAEFVVRDSTAPV